jgi:hypothetical protein
MSNSSLALALSITFGIVAVSATVPTVPSPDAAAVARGRVTYNQYCASCHGQNGKGDGPAAARTGSTPPDLTLMEKRFSIFLDAQLESAIRGTDPIVAHGSPGMMLWGAILRRDAANGAAGDTRIADLIAFIRSIQQKET